MPQNINNEDIWNKAKDTFIRQYGKQPTEDWQWAYINKIYQNMGGTFGDMFIPTIKSLTEKCRLKEMVGLSDIKSFVRKFIDNPIKSAIVAYLIFKILKSNAESFNEAVGDCKKLSIRKVEEIKTKYGEDYPIVLAKVKNPEKIGASVHFVALDKKRDIIYDLTLADYVKTMLKLSHHKDNVSKWMKDNINKSEFSKKDYINEIGDIYEL